jgi:dolichyl-diphosphooligosaccharide--protein glycosyltransferase
MSTRAIKKREKSMSPERAKKAASTASAAAASAPNSSMESTSIGRYLLRIVVVLVALMSAYNIRLHALETYGNVIHEFDPWFNYRATVYLRDHGVEKFFKWYDHKVWYPLGRPVGTTIYPGMQLTSVFIYNTLESMNMPMSLNDVCCYVPAWFGVLATAFLGLLAYECTGNPDVGALASLIMAIVPA